VSADFEAARAFFLAGVSLFEQGRFAEAEQQLLASLDRVPGRPSTLVNLGAARLALGRPADALAPLDAALAADAAQADAWRHRGAACTELGRDADALASFERALALEPADPQAGRQRALVLAKLGRLDEAALQLARVLTQHPGFGAAWALLGHVEKDRGQRDAARAAFERAIANGADDPTNRWCLAALGGAPAPENAPRGYVQALFDGYANDFDRHLVDVLGYRTPEAVVRLVADGAPWRSALDLGCGTGLCGPGLKAIAARVAGIDLSTEMLAKARERGDYDELVAGDIVEHLQRTERRHDVVVAADVFVYVGELEPVFAGVRRVLDAGGRFAFSIEAGDEGVPFALHSGFRYAHGERYVRALAQAHGFGLRAWERVKLREEQRRPIEGFVVCLA
jgi:predicted TPR repeat methyltransferase